MVVPAGRRLAFMILSSDNEHTLRPAPGTQLTLDTAQSSVSLPIVGGAAGAGGGDRHGVRRGAGRRHRAGDARA